MKTQKMTDKQHIHMTCANDVNLVARTRRPLLQYDKHTANEFHILFCFGETLASTCMSYYH